MIDLSDEKEDRSYWHSENNFQFHLCLDFLLNKKDA